MIDTESTITSDVPMLQATNELVSRRIAVTHETEQSIDTMSSSNPSSSMLTRGINRCVITHSSEDKTDDTAVAPSRLVINRNVVLAESAGASSRTIVPIISSNRIVVSSDHDQSCPLSSTTANVKRCSIESDNSIEQENNTKKFKSNCPLSK
jgi:hypothetical protein